MKFILNKPSYILTLLLTLIHISTISAQWVQKGELIKSLCDSNNGYVFPEISGNGNVVAIEQLPGYNDPCPVGIVVFEWTNNSWQQKGSLITGIDLHEPNNALKFNYDGSILISSALGGANFQGPGAAKVFHFINNDWELKGNSIISPDSVDYCGDKVDIDSTGNTFITISSINNEPVVSVYDWLNSQWTKRPNDIEASALEITISLDGSTIAFSHRDVNSLNIIIDIYRWENNAWSFKGNIIKYFTTELGRFIDLSRDGKTLITSYETNVDKVQIYDWNSNNDWIQRGNTIHTATENVSISADAKRIIVSDNEFQPVNNEYLNYLKIYDWIDSSWVQINDSISTKSFPYLDYIYHYAFDLSENGENIIFTGRDTNNNTSGGFIFNISEPRACFDIYDNKIECGEIVNITSLCSSHTIDININTLYEWDLNNDGNYDQQGVNLVHQFSTSGLKTIKLRVTDQNNQKDSVTNTFTVYELSDSISRHHGTLNAKSIGTISNYTYQWYNCLDSTEVINETNSSFTPTVNGSYYLVTENNYCNTISNCIEINNVNLSELNSEKASVFYDNLKKEIILKYPDNFQIKEILIYDVLGRNYQIHDFLSKNIDFQNKKGIYIIQLKSKDSIIKTKFIIR